MKRYKDTATLIRRLSVALAVGVVSLQVPTVHAQALGSSFTVQGALSDAGVAESGPVDLRFRLFDAQTGGNQVGSLVTRTNVMLDDGIFSVIVDFGDNAFLGQQRWIQIEVRDTGSGDPYTTLTPRRPALPTPNALFANKAAAAQDLFNVMGDDATLTFGPNNACAIGIRPNIPGLLLQDPNCIRILPAFPGVPPILKWGPTDNCFIGIMPDLPGLSEVDPFGFRLLGENLEGCRLLFGPTNDCTIEIDPDGPPGLLLRDPNFIRILNPIRDLPNVLAFGESNECIIQGMPKDIATPGLVFSDPRGFGFEAGFVGINLGEDRPGFPLHVNGVVGAEDFIQFSSSEFKTDVRPLDNALSLIEALEGVSFNWKEMNEGRADVGFIAEEVEKVLPQLVRLKDGKATGIAYHRLTAVTVEAIKAQQRQIASLNQERDELTDRVAQLEAGLARVLEQIEKGEN